MSNNQFENEIMYMLSKEILKRMFLRKLITEEEYEKIDKLNIKTFNPEIAQIYDQIIDV